MKNWIAHKFMQTNTDLAWNEWAAATGSTLGIFSVLQLVSSSTPMKQKRGCIRLIFPGSKASTSSSIILLTEVKIALITILILLFITTIISMLLSESLISIKSREMISQLPHRNFHQLILDGLIAMYGSDPKLREQKLDGAYLNMLDTPTPYHA